MKTLKRYFQSELDLKYLVFPVTAKHSIWFLRKLIDCKAMGKSKKPDIKPIDQKDGVFLKNKDFLSFFHINNVDVVRQAVQGVKYLHRTAKVCK